MAMMRFSEFVAEAVRASEVRNAYTSLESLLPPGFDESGWLGGEPPVGRRRVCYTTRGDLNHPPLVREATKMYDRLMSMGFKRVDVAGENGAFIVYHPTAEAQAMELKAIAERYRGYLSMHATREETRRIGQLLEYDPADIEAHLAKNYGPVTESRDWAVWLALAASLGLGSAARAETPGERARVVDTVRRRTTRAEYMPEFERARDRVRAKVASSANITNKAELMDRLDSVEVREYSARSTTMMYYLRDPSGSRDYVFVNTRVYRPEVGLGTFVHELNHLVDKNKTVAKESPHEQVLLRPSYREYQEWFAGWPPLTHLRGRETRKPVQVGRMLANSVSRMRGYLNTPHEVYARLSSLKDFLVRNGYMQQGERLERRHVERLADWAKGLAGKEYHDFLMNDFVLVLPMIDWRCPDEINLIAAGPRPDNSSKA